MFLKFSCLRFAAIIQVLSSPLLPHAAGDVGAKKSDELTKKRNVLQKFADEL